MKQAKHMITKSSSWKELKDAEKKFVKASEQFSLINRQYDDLKWRYSKSKMDRNSCFRYNLRLKMSVLEGVRQMYYDYVYMKAEDITMLRRFVKREADRLTDVDEVTSVEESEK